jgi:hypothetical protein
MEGHLRIPDDGGGIGAAGLSGGSTRRDAPERPSGAGCSPRRGRIGRTLAGVASCAILLTTASGSSAFEYRTEITGQAAVKIYDSMTESEGAFVKDNGEKAKVFVHYERRETPTSVSGPK